MPAEKPMKEYKEKPQMTVYSDDLPEIKNFSIDGSYVLRVRVNVKKLGKGDEYGMMMEGEGKESKRMYAKCEITSVELDEDKEEEDTMENFNKKKVAVHDNRKM